MSTNSPSRKIFSEILPYQASVMRKQTGDTEIPTWVFPGAPPCCTREIILAPEGLVPPRTRPQPLPPYLCHIFPLRKTPYCKSPQPFYSGAFAPPIIGGIIVHPNKAIMQPLKPASPHRVKEPSRTLARTAHAGNDQNRLLFLWLTTALR